MSKDFQIARKCDHLTREECVPLHSDRRSLYQKQPIAAEGFVRLLVNDEYFVPSAGLYSTAQIKSVISGPFSLKRNENNLVIAASGGHYSIELPLGVRTTTDAVVTAIKKVSGSILAENIGGHLVLSDTSKIGPESKISVEGSAAFSLGFPQYHRGSKGRELFPPWSLRIKPGTLNTRHLYFSKPIKSNPVFKMSYSAPPNLCLRCGSSRVENDLQFDSFGDVLLVENENLLYQAALKILLTDLKSNPYHNWYGTTLKSRIGSKSIGLVAASINEEVRSTLEKLKQVQSSQAKYQRVSFKERLYSIQSVQTMQHEKDPTIFLVDVVVQNASNDPVTLSIVYTVPGAAALAGTNGMSLG